MVIDWVGFKFVNLLLLFNFNLFTRLLIFFNFIEFLFALELSGFSYDQSIAYKLLATEEKRVLQSHFLNFLGLDHRPKPKRKDLLSSIHLKEVYHKYLDEDTSNLIDEDPFLFFQDGQSNNYPTAKAFDESDVIVSFVDDNSFKSNGLNFSLNNASRFWFNTREIAPGSQVRNAELWLYKIKTPSHSRFFDLFKMNIYLIEDIGNNKLRLIESKTFSNTRGWLTFNVTGAIQTWIDDPNRNSGLYATIYSTSTGKELHPESIGLNGSVGEEEKRPFVFAFFERRSHLLHRKKREITKNEASSSKSQSPYYELSEFYSDRTCQKKSLFVNFKDLGWHDWIIAPDGYAASWCDGECEFPLTAQSNATNHAIVQTLAHLMNEKPNVRANCAATKLSSIMVLYFDDNANVILKKYRNMVVKACGCH